ncbi:MAG TPA: M13 family metallopeptidase [Candidatus Acidoferrales bacterium]|nr:M13 family metallopeptidase [Candidatus Acidoferrales bacterium]
MKYAIRCALAVVSALMLTALAAPRQAQTAQTQTGGKLDAADFDHTCKPCEDFFRFVNGGWMAKNAIPAAFPTWGRLNIMAEHNRDVLHAILEEAAAKTNPAGSVEQKIGDFYGSCMDETKIDAAGLHPLDDEFARIAKISDRASLREEIARLQSFNVHAPFNFGSTIDFKNSSEQTGGAEQSGLGLPDRDYYTKTDPKSTDIKSAYQRHVAKMLVLAGDAEDKAAAEAQTVMDIENKLASASMTRADMRDPSAIYHRMGLGELKAATPDFDWPAYFKEVGYPDIRVVNLSQPDFFKEFDAQYKNLPLDSWKIYLRWHLLHASAPYLSKPFVDENFDFFGRTLQGTKEQQPRWRRCVAAADRALGEALGQKYVERAFPPEAKARALTMVHNLIDALHTDIESLPWMSAPTKVQALGKLNAITLKIGYPDKWRDYSAYKVDRGPYVLNVFHANQFEVRRDLDKVGKPVDRAEWIMTPPTVNAYYNPQFNEIVFPAGILQPPAFDPAADDALNYGAMGAVIGHELTHGFDDEGRQFDAQGNLRDWWTPEDGKNFDERAACIQKQFDAYAVGDVHENGKLVLGESIADLGGLVIAHMAFEKATKGQSQAPVDGFTPEQRFFIGYARVWAENARPEYERLLATTDEHPLPRFRVNGAFSNLPAFAEAFSCKEGDPLATPANQRCRIW